jgi:hypothetical protein
MGYPTIYPTGVTVNDPDRSWAGFTLLNAADYGALLIDPNGKEVQLWKGLSGFPNALLPGGMVLGHTGERHDQLGDFDDLVQVDWHGQVVWRFDRFESGSDPRFPRQWRARVHHDFQREGSPVGYYAPEQRPMVDGGRSLLLVHRNVTDQRISAWPLLDDSIIEIDWDGRILWCWHAHEHIDELGFDEEARRIIRANPNLRPPVAGDPPPDCSGPAPGRCGDWLHINAMSRLGPNRWWDAGDPRFHPDNVMWCAREANIIAIIDKATGRIVWRLGPRFDGGEAERRIGQIIGQHHAHIIPHRLPGAGNLLVFDNGGAAGYGSPRSGAPLGVKTEQRDYSRVLEIDPVSLAIVWKYTPAEAGFVVPLDATRFYSPFISSAQRCPNGNTLICEGSDGRIIEVTPRHEIVWEYISPYWRKPPLALNQVYRAYRYPYEWVPQLKVPAPAPVRRLDTATFRVPGSAPSGCQRMVDVRGAAVRMA